MKRGKRAQVWIETVMYTLIAFAIMGLVLAYARPKIEELQDRAVIEQSISMLKDIDTALLTMGGAGNQRRIEISIKKGDLKIDGTAEKIIFEMQSRLQYSEPSTAASPKIISDGNIKIETKKSGKFNLITLSRDFKNDYNLTNTIGGEEGDGNRTISKAPVAYTLKISNKGIGEGYTDLVTCTDANFGTVCQLTNVHFNKECTTIAAGSTTKYCYYTPTRQTINFEVS